MFVTSISWQMEYLILALTSLDVSNNAATTILCILNL